MQRWMLSIPHFLALAALFLPSLAIQNTAPPSLRSILLADFKNVDVLDKIGAFRLYWTVDRVVQLDDKLPENERKASTSTVRSGSRTTTTAPAISRTSARGVITTTSTSRTTTSARPIQVSTIPGVSGSGNNNVRLDDSPTRPSPSTDDEDYDDDDDDERALEVADEDDDSSDDIDD
ncbi:hypothetical protein BJ742DRAFT_739115 [Cladochytrium replicatum]|nr:hypothetical protein BJ742DRAFT_739115 [Cladochytrium replicatum]